MFCGRYGESNHILIGTIGVFFSFIICNVNVRSNLPHPYRFRMDGPIIRPNLFQNFIPNRPKVASTLFPTKLLRVGRIQGHQSINGIPAAVGRVGFIVIDPSVARHRPSRYVIVFVGGGGVAGGTAPSQDLIDGGYRVGSAAYQRWQILAGHVPRDAIPPPLPRFQLYAHVMSILLLQALVDFVGEFGIKHAHFHPFPILHVVIIHLHIRSLNRYWLKDTARVTNGRNILHKCHIFPLLTHIDQQSPPLLIIHRKETPVRTQCHDIPRLELLTSTQFRKIPPMQIL
mmetsp:Transcript_25199/g.30981  ORF Transcript_25199/g.30981 Transcript_25199/m.30981 type:complete len:286 (+) Transcript_25199:249-1106(+)